MIKTVMKKNREIYTSVKYILCLLVMITLASSANSTGMEILLKVLRKSLMCKINNKGPRFDPWSCNLFASLRTLASILH